MYAKSKLCIKLGGCNSPSVQCLVVVVVVAVVVVIVAVFVGVVVMLK